MDHKKFPNLCSWLCRVTTRSRLCQVLLICCVASVSLNIILLASRYSDTTHFKRSAVLMSRSFKTPGSAGDRQPKNAELSPPGLGLKDQNFPASKSRRRAMPSQSTPQKVKSLGQPARLTRGPKSQVLRNASSTQLGMPSQSTPQKVKSLGKPARLTKGPKSQVLRNASSTQPSQSTPQKVKSLGQPARLTKAPKSQVLRKASSTQLRMPLCPLEPPGLVGLSQPDVSATNLVKLRALFPEIERGGRIRPVNCTARERLAVIIPFRNRHPHLYILLRNLIPFLRKQMADATIFVIEQAPPSTFNRGALLNIGFLETQKISDFDCFLLHDVDLIPMNDRNLYRCGNNPHHFASAINKNRFRLNYETYFGGVTGFTKEQYIKVNGNSNLYFGWGGEDDDLALRTLNKNYTLHRYDNYTSRYIMMKHSRDKGNENNNERRRIMKSASQRQDVEGLNTTKYKVNSIKLDHLYIWINVSLSMTEVIDTAPDYTKQDMWRLRKEIRLGNIQR